MDAPWRIELLGKLRAQQGDRFVQRFKTHKIAELLIHLALNPGRSMTREHLIELLWPDDDFELTSNRFSHALSSLRRQLEPPGVPRQSVLMCQPQCCSGSDRCRRIRATCSRCIEKV